MDTWPSPTSANPISSAGVYNYIESRVGVDPVPQQGSPRLVLSNGIYNSVQNAQQRNVVLTVQPGQWVTSGTQATYVYENATINQYVGGQDEENKEKTTIFACLADAASAENAAAGFTLTPSDGRITITTSTAPTGPVTFNIRLAGSRGVDPGSVYITLGRGGGQGGFDVYDEFIVDSRVLQNATESMNILAKKGTTVVGIFEAAFDSGTRNFVAQVPEAFAPEVDTEASVQVVDGTTKSTQTFILNRGGGVFFKEYMSGSTPYTHVKSDHATLVVKYDSVPTKTGTLTLRPTVTNLKETKNKVTKNSNGSITFEYEATFDTKSSLALGEIMFNLPSEAFTTTAGIYYKLIKSDNTELTDCLKPSTSGSLRLDRHASSAATSIKGIKINATVFTRTSFILCGTLKGEPIKLSYQANYIADGNSSYDSGGYYTKYRNRVDATITSTTSSGGYDVVKTVNLVAGDSLGIIIPEHYRPTTRKSVTATFNGTTSKTATVYLNPDGSVTMGGSMSGAYRYTIDVSYKTNVGLWG